MSLCAPSVKKVSKAFSEKQLRLEFENGLVKTMNINKTFICSKIKVDNKKFLNKEYIPFKLFFKLLEKIDNI